MDITGVALIIGGGSGIGKECALAFAKEGAIGIMVGNINLHAAESSSTESKTVSRNQEFRSKSVHVDVTSLPSVEAAVEEAIKVFGRIDYCVICAGIGAREERPMAEADGATFSRFMEVNVTGTFNVTRAVSAIMKTQEPKPVGSLSSGRGFTRGAIVSMGSAASYVATPGVVQYTTSKHAVLGLSKNAALDNVAYGIRVNCLCPTWVDTPMVEQAIADMPNLEPLIKSQIPMGRLACVGEIADAALFMCSPRSSYITGCGLMIDGGSTLMQKV